MKGKITSIWLYSLVGFILLGLLSSYSFQPPIEEGKLSVSGRVKNEKKKDIDSTLILITDSTGKLFLDTIYSDNKGKFSFELDYNKVYRTYYSKPGYATIFDVYETDVPKGKLYKELTYLVSKTMFSDSSDFNQRAAERHPVLNVSFNKAYDGFYEDFEGVTAFLDEITKPNVGEMNIVGVFQDSLTDSFNVQVLALDTLGFELAQTTSDKDGNYRVTVPLMNKVRLKFISGDHYESFAMVNTKVPEVKSGTDFDINQDFVLVNKIDSTINPDAFESPIARIEHLGETGEFVENPAVASIFNDQLLIDERRILLTGLLFDNLGHSITNTKVTVKDGDRIIDEVIVDSNNFEVKLPFEAIAHVYFNSNDYHESFISYNTNLSAEEMQKNKKLSTKVELYSRERTEINPLAFNIPTNKYYYDRNIEGFANDSSVSNEFLALLQKPEEPLGTADSKGFLVIRGMISDPSIGNKKVPDARVRILDEDKQVLSAFGADKKGRFQTQLGLNKIYFLEVEKEEYLPTQIKFDTRVAEGKSNETIEQIGVLLPVIHQDNKIGDKQVPPSIVEEYPTTGFYIDSTLTLTEDFDVFDRFAEAVVNYEDPSTAEVPAVTLAQLEEDKRRKEELELLNKKKPKIPELRIAGKIVDERNIPISGALVSLTENNKTIEKTETDSLGNYNIQVPTQKNMDLLVSGDNLHTVKTNVNTIYPDTLEPKSDILVLPDLKAYNKANIGVNPKAFDQNWQAVAYNPSSNSFALDEETPNSFASILESIPDNQYLLVNGRAKDQKGRNISDAQIVVRANGSVVTTLYTDKKGRYNAKLEYQKDYRFEVKKNGYSGTFAALSTKTNTDQERLIDKKIKSLNLLLVSKDEKNLNDKVFYRPYAQVAYDPKLDEFVEVAEITDEFLADMYIEEVEDEEGKKEYQLKSTVVASAFEVSDEKGYKEYVSRAGASKTAAQKRSQNKNAASKAASPFMGVFTDALSGIQQSRRTQIRDVSLTLNEIYNARVAMSQKPKLEIDENMVEANEQKSIMNNIIASALGMRGSGDLVSTDSTLNINLIPRINHFVEGTPLYRITRDQVFVEGKQIEYVNTVDWGLWNTYYRDNKKIRESVYSAELDSLNSYGNQLN
ncbi:MAG: carboxypeptidase-like regulatory domain-containing protein [Salibacteraceae bacterium]